MNSTARFLPQNDDSKNKVGSVPFPDNSKLLHTQSNFGQYRHKGIMQGKMLAKNPQKKVRQESPKADKYEDRNGYIQSRQTHISARQGKLSSRSPSMDRFPNEPIMIQGKSGIFGHKSPNQRSLVKIE